MQDINLNEKRSIRNISMDKPGSQGEQAANGSGDTGMDTTPREPLNYSLPPRPLGMGGRRRVSKLWWWVGGIVAALIILVIGISVAFAGATVTVTPRHAVVNLDSNLVAYASPAPGEVGYTSVTLSKEGSREVQATGEEAVESQASGTIIVYNNHDEKPQTLIRNTRFATPEGLVFRIRDAIVVPGKRTNERGETVPGSVETQVYADKPGEEYNIGLTDFKIPGFKEGNDPRYDTFYARSKTEMTGGFKGVVKTASDADTQAAQEAIKAELEQTLAADATAGAPEGFVIVDDTQKIAFEELPNAPASGAESVLIRMKGTISALAVNSDSLAAYAAASLVSDYDNEPVKFENPQAVTIAVAGETGTSTASAAAPSEGITLDVTGAAVVVWTYDAGALAADLAGATRKETALVFSRYPGIEKADVVLRPFWKRSMPKDATDIEIKETKINE